MPLAAEKEGRLIAVEVKSFLGASELDDFVCDDALGHYQIGQVGWDNKRRVDEVFLHIDVVDGKVWLQHDGTNLRIAEDLIRAGVPKEHVVLAFHHPSRRPDTEFAVA